MGREGICFFSVLGKGNNPKGLKNDPVRRFGPRGRLTLSHEDPIRHIFVSSGI